MPYKEYSKSVVKDFLRTVTFIDDRIFGNPKISSSNPNVLTSPGRKQPIKPEPNEKIEGASLDVNSLMDAFAQKGMHCSLCEYRDPSQMDSYKRLLEKSDVGIIDWEMKNGQPGVEACEFIAHLLNVDSEQALRIVIVYTQLPKASWDDVIKNNLEPIFHERTYLTTENIIESGLTKVILVNKAEIIEEELPQLIINLLSEMTAGIVPNTALKAISLIRENTNKILGTFNKKLDPAFLAHRAMLPYPDDAGDLLLSTLIDSIYGKLSYSDLSNCYSMDAINAWLDTMTLSTKKIKVNKSSKYEIQLGNDQLKYWLKNGYVKCIKKELKDQKGYDIADNQLDNFDRNQLVKEVPSMFVPDGDYSDYMHEEFSILTHQMRNSIDLNIKPPQLTLGTLVEKFGFYYLCIQQPCDSVRIGNNECRRFLFLKLEETDKQYSILVKKGDDYLKLKPGVSSHNLLTFSFRRTFNGSVIATKNTMGFFFKDFMNHKYKWILDLKKSHAQKISNEFSSNLSRVGLDESEWLRRS